MFLRHPKIAKRWAKKYGTIKSKKVSLSGRAKKSLNKA